MDHVCFFKVEKRPRGALEMKDELSCMGRLYDVEWMMTYHVDEVRAMNSISQVVNLTIIKVKKKYNSSNMR